MPDTITKLDLIAVTVTPKTVWTFLRATSSSGLLGLGEATLTGQEDAIATAAHSAGASVISQPIDGAEALFPQLPFSTLPEAAFSSALLQAIRDLEAQAKGVPVAGLLGGMQRAGIPVYANINRRTLDRSPAGFAASVQDALNAGHEAFKIAPFDDLTPDLDISDARPLIAAGIARIEAVRDAIGQDKRLMVDCHWRFRPGWALDTLEALKPVGLHWFECPVPDTEEMIPDLLHIRTAANQRGVLLAGLEQSILRGGFTPFLEAGAFDVMMPDVKYAGGPDEMMRIAEDFAQAGVTFSPHNPSGPICHAHSLQVCAALPDLAVLETQFDETPLFDEVVGQELPPSNEGAISLSDSAPGIGVSLDQPVLDTLETRILWHTGA